MRLTRLTLLLTTLNITCSAGLLLGVEMPVKGADSPGPIRITGEVTNVRPAKARTAGYVSFEMTLTLHFVNQSSSPVLFFVMDNYPLLGGKVLARSKEDAVAKNWIFASSTWPSFYGQNPMDKLRRKLDQPSPPPECIRTIGPGSSWDFRDHDFGIFIEREGSFDGTSRSWAVIKKVDPLWLRVEFQTWSVNADPDPLNRTFGRKLQKRWSSSGRLILNNIMSEPIPLSLPAEMSPNAGKRPD